MSTKLKISFSVFLLFFSNVVFAFDFFRKDSLDFEGYWEGKLALKSVRFVDHVQRTSYTYQIYLKKTGLNFYEGFINRENKENPYFFSGKYVEQVYGYYENGFLTLVEFNRISYESNNKKDIGFMSHKYECGPFNFALLVNVSGKDTSLAMSSKGDCSFELEVKKVAGHTKQSENAVGILNEIMYPKIDIDSFFITGGSLNVPIQNPGYNTVWCAVHYKSQYQLPGILLKINPVSEASKFIQVIEKSKYSTILKENESTRFNIDILISKRLTTLQFEVQVFSRGLETKTTPRLVCSKIFTLKPN